jgi:hypothetical protein
MFRKRVNGAFQPKWPHRRACAVCGAMRLPAQAPADSKQVTVFFEALGIWIDADRTSPKETFVRRTQLSNEKKTASSTSILKAVELLP